MVPEEGGADGRAVRLYEATDFPEEWEPRATLVSADHRTDDTVLFRWGNRWWLLVGDGDVAGFRAYHSDSLVADDWEPHRENPVVTDRPAAFRPGGRPIVGSDGVVVFFQDCERRYGEAVRAFEVTELDPEHYADAELRESPILEGTGARIGWNSGRMHHVDPWCVDGRESPILEGTGARIGWNSGRMHHVDPWCVDGRWLCAVDGNVSHPGLFTNDHWSIGVTTVDPD
ncbi:glucosamine inositolphosphorylceramide transferase family protein [Halorubrum lipolyticum]